MDKIKKYIKETDILLLKNLEKHQTDMEEFKNQTLNLKNYNEEKEIEFNFYEINKNIEIIK